MSLHAHTRQTGVSPLPTASPLPADNAARALALLARCPDYAVTPLLELASIAQEIGIGALSVKDERGRMGLGSFKALGAAFVIALAAQNRDLSNETFVTASAGNHGLSVAAGAQVFGAKAVVYLSQTVPNAFADKLRSRGGNGGRRGHRLRSEHGRSINRCTDKRLDLAVRQLLAWLYRASPTK